LHRSLKYILILFCICISGYTSLAQNKTIDSLLQVIKISNHDTTRCFLLNIIVESYAEESIWVKHNNQMRNLAEKNLKELGPADSLTKNVFLKYLSLALNNFGYLSDSKGNIPLAIDYYSRSLAIMSQIGNKEGIAVCLNNIGFVYDNQGNIAQALEYYSRSLKIQEEIGNKKGIAQSYNNIASIYEHQNDIEKALDYYNQSLKLKISINDKPGTATALNNIGHILVIKKDYNKALLYFQKSLNIHIALQNKTGISIVLGNIAEINENQGNYSKALNLYQESLKNAQEVDDKESILTALNAIGNIFYKRGDFKKALQVVLQSAEENKKIGYAENAVGSAQLLYKIYTALNDPKNALSNYEFFILMRDSINNQETRKISLRSQLKYEYEKKSAADSVRVAEEKKVVAVQLKQEKTQRYALYGGLGFVGLFALFMVNRFRVTNKQKKLIEEQKKIVEDQKHLVDEKQKEILDSIRYAKRIQQSLLPTETYINRNLKNNNS
jgi:tetratricopeptide (TPR) repeat protein